MQFHLTIINTRKLQGKGSKRSVFLQQEIKGMSLVLDNFFKDLKDRQDEAGKGSSACLKCTQQIYWLILMHGKFISLPYASHTAL